MRQVLATLLALIATVCFGAFGTIFSTARPQAQHPKPRTPNPSSPVASQRSLASSAVWFFCMLRVFVAAVCGIAGQRIFANFGKIFANLGESLRILVNLDSQPRARRVRRSCVGALADHRVFAASPLVLGGALLRSCCSAYTVRPNSKP